MSRLPRWLFVVGIVGVVTVLALVGGIAWTSRPQYCRSCHQIAPYYDSWEISAHREFKCGTCHWGDGVGATIRSKAYGLTELAKQITGQTDGPLRAHIPDERCVPCHGPVTEPIVYRKVPYDHEQHLNANWMGMQLACTSCHYQLDTPNSAIHIVSPTDPCYLCHLYPTAPPSWKDCMSCHAEELRTEPATARFRHAPILQEGLACDSCHEESMQGNGVVGSDTCQACHSADVDTTKREPDRMHTLHVPGAHAACVDCHERIHHSFASE